MVWSTHHIILWDFSEFSFLCIFYTPPPSSFMEKWKRVFISGFENFEKWIFLENIFLGLEVYGVLSGIIFISGFCYRRIYCIQKFF